jgi:multidrug efflux pump
MMCARLLDSPADEDRRRPLGRRFRDKIPVEAFMERMSRSYENLLRKTLNRKIAVLLGAFSLGGLGFLMYKVLPSQFLPKEDAGMIWFEGHSPQSSTIDYTERYVQKLDKILAEIPDVASRDISITNPTFKGYIELKKDRKRSSEAVAEEVRIKFDEVTGVEVLKMQAGYGGSGGDSSTVSFVVRGNKSHKELRELGIAVGREVMYAGLAKSLLTVSKNDTEDYTVTILRDKVLSMFIEPATIADTIDALIRGRKVNTFKKDNKLYDVKVEVENESRSTPEDILNIYVKGGERGEKLVPLSELILLTPRSGPVDIHHYNGTRSVEITNILESRYGVNDGIKHVELVKNEILPKDVVLEFTGGTKEYLKESRVMGMVFGLALIFIYLVMAAQFESWRDPLIILFSVPLAIASALITLGLIKNGSLNLYSNIGLITLIGLITKHGILLVDFANKKQLQENLSVTQAIVQAGLVRLRPVVMTTLAMVLGNLPLAFATGAGAETRWQLGWTIVGGMTLGTIFTMFIVPIFYLLFSKVKEPMVLEEEGIPEGVVASLG